MDDADPIPEPRHSFFAVWHWPWDIWLPLGLLGCLIGWPVCLGTVVVLRILLGLQ